MTTFSGVVSFIALVLLSWQAADEPAPNKSHRLFQPVQLPAVPVVRGQARTEIDRFILQLLESKQLAMNPEADRATLIRRVSFDLTGLPPTIKELNQFLQDTTPDAYDKMLERALASPHYGERWGKYWLDAAGYADSNGYFNADSDRPLAWKYRDYVVKSFNSDKPYDQFVREQLAGDELVGYSPDKDVTPAMVESLIATHFLRNAPDGTGESDGNPDEVRTDRFSVLEGNVQNLMNSLLGLTVQCARCHDHKFEPITQKEYYSLQAILFPVYNPDRWTKPNDRAVSIGKKADLADQQRLSEQVDRQIKVLRDGLTALAEPLREQFRDERLKKLDAELRTKLEEALKAQKEKRTAEQKKLLKAHAKDIDFSEDELAKRFPEFAAFRHQTQQTVSAREKEKPPASDKIAAFVETDAKPPNHHLLRRGLHHQPADEVQPGVPAFLNAGKLQLRLEPRTVNIPSTGRRTALARWITHPGNPLFARVMVNRIWQHHFGTGLVATVDNLGVSGAKPYHPELLDYLAAEFIQNGWSIKKLHRLIMKSAVYRQSSSPRTELDKADADNRWLGKFPLRRLDAEAVRDGMLAASGELDQRSQGPYVPSQRNAEGSVVIDIKTDGALRRSIYLQQRRTQVVTFLQLFDAPSIVTTCGMRTTSTVPLQSLAFLNSDFSRQRSLALANKVLKETENNDSQRIDRVFLLLCSRPPDNVERNLCAKFLATQRSLYTKQPEAEVRVWTDLCHMLFASNLFLYVE